MGVKIIKKAKILLVGKFIRVCKIRYMRKLSAFKRIISWVVENTFLTKNGEKYDIEEAQTPALWPS